MRLNATTRNGRHKQIVRYRGRADGHSCRDCGGKARDWSQRHGTDGLDSNDFDPRCRSCHKKYDPSIDWLTKEEWERVSETIHLPQAEAARIIGKNIKWVNNARYRYRKGRQHNGSPARK